MRVSHAFSIRMAYASVTNRAMKMDTEWTTLLVLFGTIFLFAALSAIRGLKLLQLYDRQRPPFGARRVRFIRGRGDTFTSKEAGFEFSRASTILIFLLNDCYVCSPVIRVLPLLAKENPDTDFVLCSNTEWPELRRLASYGIKIREKSTVASTLGISMYPYAMRIDNDRIVDYGLINNGEHIESLINAQRVVA